MKKYFLIIAALSVLVSCSDKKGLDTENVIEATYNLEGEPLTKYLDEVQYDTDYSYTKVHDYIVQSTESLSFQPAYYIVPTDCKADSVFLVSDRGEKTTRAVYGTGKKAIYNLIPGRTYTYTLKSSEGEVLKTACFKTEGRLRIIKTKNLHNFRDMGGWATMDGKHIKYGYLIRGGETQLDDDLTTCDPLDKIYLLDQVGINYDMDFRTDEGAGYFYESPLGIEFLRVPLSAYSSVVTEKSRKAPYKQCILQFIENTKAGKCTYMHCQGGADRTGTIVFFIEGLLGVSESDLAKDYEITTFYYHKERNDTERYATMIKALMNSYSKGGSLHDAIYNWAISAGLTDDNINELRTLMLE